MSAQADERIQINLKRTDDRRISWWNVDSRGSDPSALSLVTGRYAQSHAFYSLPVPWDELFENHMDFVFSIDHPDRHSSFLNRHPLPGELAEYSPNSDGKKGKAYGVIAFLPNLGTSGNVLILEGLSMVGTEATTDLAMDDKRLLPLLNSMRKKDGSLPHFEMLLESGSLGDGSGPARVVAIHLHD